jgi:hypothetical protein
MVTFYLYSNALISISYVLDGSECLLCTSPEFEGIFLDILEQRLSMEKAEHIRELYKSSKGYEA